MELRGTACQVPHKQLKWVTFDNKDSAKVNLARRRAIALFSAAALNPSRATAKASTRPSHVVLQLDDHRADNKT
jgi:hypothetical protein